jgi:hypothetical protein
MKLVTLDAGRVGVDAIIGRSGKWFTPAEAPDPHGRARRPTTPRPTSAL